MNTIIVKTQAEFDALPKSFREYTQIFIQDTGGIRLSISRIPENAHAVLWENAHAVLWGNAHAVLWGNAHAELRENAHAELWENAHAVLWGNAHAELRENAHAVLWENAHAELWGNAHADVHAQACVYLQSNFATVFLFAFAVCIALAKGKIEKKSKTATIITPELQRGLAGWLEQNGIEEADTLILYKRVSADFKTQENTENVTVWTIGATLIHRAWKPASSECGAGKFHACSRAYFCDEFRNNDGDRYVAIEVTKADLHAWDGAQYPHKIAVRKAKVLYECDRYGRKVSS